MLDDALRVRNQRDEQDDVKQGRVICDDKGAPASGEALAADDLQANDPKHLKHHYEDAEARPDDCLAAALAHAVIRRAGGNEGKYGQGDDQPAEPETSKGKAGSGNPPSIRDR